MRGEGVRSSKVGEATRFHSDREATNTELGKVQFRGLSNLLLCEPSRCRFAKRSCMPRTHSFKAGPNFDDAIDRRD